MALPFTRRLHTSKGMLEPKPRVPLCVVTNVLHVCTASTLSRDALTVIYSSNACEVRMLFTVMLCC